MEDLGHLESVARAAPQGEWSYAFTHYRPTRLYRLGVRREMSIEAFADAVEYEDPASAFRHMATFDPPTILALIKRIRELEGRAWELEAAIRIAKAGIGVPQPGYPTAVAMAYHAIDLVVPE